MKKYSIKYYNLIVLITLICFSCNKTNKTKSSRVGELPYYKDASFTPHWISSDDNSLKTFHKIPSFSLVNQEGKTVTEKTFNDKIYITDFFFTTCPGICPKMTANMMVLQEEFLDDDEILLLSHSVTPETDSISVLRDYAVAKGIVNSKWHIVTGDRKEIYDLGRKSYFIEEDLGEVKSEDDFLHTENFVLVDKKKHIRGIYNGLNKASVFQLIADVKTLKKEN